MMVLDLIWELKIFALLLLDTKEFRPLSVLEYQDIISDKTPQDSAVI